MQGKINPSSDFSKNIELAAHEAMTRMQRLDCTHLLYVLLKEDISATTNDILRAGGLKHSEILSLCAKIGLLLDDKKESHLDFNENGTTPQFAYMLLEMSNLAEKKGYSFLRSETFFPVIFLFVNEAKEILKISNVDQDAVVKKALEILDNHEKKDSNPSSNRIRVQRVNLEQEDGQGSMQKNMSSDEALKKYTINLTEKARKNLLSPIFGRTEEINSIIQTLSRKNKSNVLLVGHPGVGKTAIIEGLAQLIASGDVPNNLKDKEILSLDLSSLVAGAKYRGQFEERLKQLVNIIKSEDKYIVFIDEFHQVIGLGQASDGGTDASNILKPELARGELTCIGATTEKEFKSIEKHSAFLRRFQVLRLKEPTTEEALSILRGLKESYQTHHNLLITDEALKSAVLLSERYLTESYLPDKAIDLIDMASAMVKIELDTKPEKMHIIQQEIVRLKNELNTLIDEQNSTDDKKLLQTKIDSLTQEYSDMENIWIYQMSKHIAGDKLNEMISEAKKIMKNSLDNSNLEEAARIQNETLIRLEKLQSAKNNSKKFEKSHINELPLFRKIVTEIEIREIISKMTKIPVDKISQKEKSKLLNLETQLKKSIIGQDKAIKAISSAIRRSQSGLSNKEKPMASFLFLGPTGVGKTEITKALSKEIFNGEDDIIRVDMGEYGQAHSGATLFGAPPGYVGYGQGGVLTEAVKRNPYSIVLLDEVEKAHPKVFNSFLKILDEGKAKDGDGLEVNFRNTIIIMTSNLGSKQLQEKLGMSSSSIGFSRPVTVTDMDDDESYELVKDTVMEEVKDFFAPEFLNRIDDIIVFTPLNKKLINAITANELQKIVDRAKEMKMAISFDNTILDYVSENGYDSAMGARPIKRFIENNIVSFLSDNILNDAINKAKKNTIKYQGDKLVLVSK